MQRIGCLEHTRGIAMYCTTGLRQYYPLNVPCEQLDADILS